MKRLLTIASAVTLVFAAAFPVTAEPGAASPELDEFWSEVSRTIVEGDFDGYAGTYHPDAILVSSARETSYPIALALKGWEQGFDDTRSGKAQATVEFRFTRRLNDETTAHETGIFHYSSRPEEGELFEQYLHFEALLVKKDGWKMMMEYQKEPATEEEWAAAE